MGDPSRKPLIPLRLVLAAAFLTASFLASDIPGLGVLLWAALLFASLVTLLHGQGQAVLNMFWRIVRYNKLVDKQSHCTICKRPTRVLAIEYRELKVEGILDPTACYSCGVCGKIALFHIDIPFSRPKKGEKVEEPKMSNVCRDHHPNPLVGKFAEATLERLRAIGQLHLWVQPILYPMHIKPTYDPSRHHHLCGDHYPIMEVGSKCDETAAYFAGCKASWGALIPVYEPGALLSGKDAVKK